MIGFGEKAQVWAMGLRAKAGDMNVTFDNGAPNRFVDADEYEKLWHSIETIVTIVHDLSNAMKTAQDCMEQVRWYFEIDEDES